MTEYDIQMKKSSDGVWDKLYPITFARNVVTKDEQPLDEFLTNHLNEYVGFKVTTKDKIENVEKDIKNHVSKRHHNSNNIDTLQADIFKAQNGELTISEGTYLIDKPLKIRSNTKIYAYGVVFKRNADINNMFINDSDGSKGEYLANRNIEIYGATFDGSGGQFSDKCTLLALSHVENVKIIDCIFRNLKDWHECEINACQNVLIDKCFFENYGSSTTGSEMLQIDLAKGYDAFPWFGPYDKTSCNNIVIRNTRFTDGVRAIGTHSDEPEVEHTRITIEHCEFKNMRGEAIYGLNWGFTKINDNHLKNVQIGIQLKATLKSVYNHKITDNYLNGRDNDGSRGIMITGLQDGEGVRGGTISGNRVKLFGSHGIGIDFSEIWTVNNNDVTSCGKTGIIIYGSYHVTVSDNMTIYNNQLKSGSFHDIHLYSTTSKTIVHDNLCEKLNVGIDVKETLTHSNFIKDTLKIFSTDTNKSFNNMVKGEVIP